MSAWRGREIHKAPRKQSRSQAERLGRERELVEIRETHRRLKAEYLERRRRRVA